MNFGDSWGDLLDDAPPNASSSISVNLDNAWGDAFEETSGDDGPAVSEVPNSAPASSTARRRGRPKGSTGTTAWRQLRTLVLETI